MRADDFVGERPAAEHDLGIIRAGEIAEQAADVLEIVDEPVGAVRDRRFDERVADDRREGDRAGKKDDRRRAAR